MKIRHAAIIPLALMLVISLVLAGSPASTQASDFNGDGIDDLVVGVPEEDLPTADAGMIDILFGSKGAGISTAGGQYFQQIWAGDMPEAEDHFGYAIAVGNFNGDGFYDLAIGVPFEDVGSPEIEDAGAVHVIYGKSNGLDLLNSVFLTQGSGLIQDEPEEGDFFGHALAAADFNNDGYDDLVIGVPNEDFDGKTDAGVIQVFMGSPSGISTEFNQRWTQDIVLDEGDAENTDLFGFTLAAADFNGDGYADLAVSSPYETLFDTTDPVNDGGMVNIMYGSGNVFTGEGVQTFNQPKTGAVDVIAEEYDRFGYTLADGDFNGDGYADLVIGVPYENIGTSTDAGAAHILYGGSGGLASRPTSFFNRNMLHSSTAAVGDYFASAITSGDFDGNGCDELAVGVKGANYSTLNDIGVVYIARGEPGGLLFDDPLLLMQLFGFSDSLPENGDMLGFSLAAGNFNGDRYADLAIGVPGEDSDTTPAVTDSGAVHVAFGSAEGLTTAGAQYLWEGMDGVGDDLEALTRYGLVLAAIPHLTYSVYLPVTVK